ncbi:MAG TPA: hypothetical protein VK277_12035 [Acidimicrobiales bacterium]|nr:hypothetical protein [Acidimicrobiales bacterium]
MTDIAFDAQDLENLGRKLDELAAALDEREKTLLVAVIALANEALEARAVGEVAGFAMPSVNEIVVTKTTDVSSPNLFQGCLGGSQGGAPSESLSLNFTKISFNYS